MFAYSTKTEGLVNKGHVVFSCARSGPKLQVFVLCAYAGLHDTAEYLGQELCRYVGDGDVGVLDGLQPAHFSGVELDLVLKRVDGVFSWSVRAV
jgi:hypothetical protein